MTVQEFQSILETQTVLFQQLSEHQVNLQEAVIEKDYPGAEKSISAMKELSEGIRDCETRRQLAFEELLHQMNISPEFGLTMLFATLEDGQREKLASAFLELKIAVLQVRTVNEGIMAYSGSQLETMEGIVDELYPQRRDGTYTSRGMHSTSAQPVVLDHSL